jgi:hypothetical protein
MMLTFGREHLYIVRVLDRMTQDLSLSLEQKVRRSARELPRPRPHAR